MFKSKSLGQGANMQAESTLRKVVGQILAELGKALKDRTLKYLKGEQSHVLADSSRCCFLLVLLMLVVRSVLIA